MNDIQALIYRDASESTVKAVLDPLLQTLRSAPGVLGGILTQFRQDSLFKPIPKGESIFPPDFQQITRPGLSDPGVWAQVSAASAKARADKKIAQIESDVQTTHDRIQGIVARTRAQQGPDSPAAKYLDSVDAEMARGYPLLQTALTTCKGSVDRGGDDPLQRLPGWRGDDDPVYVQIAPSADKVS